MTSQSTVLDDLEHRIAALDAQLPAERSIDERDAAASMRACVHELRRFAESLPVVRAAYTAAQDDVTQEAARSALRRLIHDLRTPAGVLYTYLRLIVAGILFQGAAPALRSEAAALVDVVAAIRDQAKMEDV